MTVNYREVIKENCDKHSPVNWWPKFAFHYTNLTNAVSILSCGKLYSRISAEALGLMANDNASRQVIDMTQTGAEAFVRFYFRPLTPTQYHNEGFKHPALRYDGDMNANVPVPVFLLFDLEKLLSTPGFKFSEGPQSGHGSKPCDSIEEFAQFEFKKIYSTGRSENVEELKRYRHAEILYPGEFEIDSCVKWVLCRNNVERITLLNYLKEENMNAYQKYLEKIKVCREDLFEKNGLFVSECQYHSGVISVSFSESFNKEKYTRRMMLKNQVTTLGPIRGRLELMWPDVKSGYNPTAKEVAIDYEKTKTIQFRNIPEVPSAKSIKIRFFVEESPMCFIEQPLGETELIK